MENVQIVDLKQFVKLRPKYIRILLDDNKLYGQTEQTIKTKIGSQTLDLWFETEIEIELRGSYTQKPRMFHLHRSHAKTFLTLLALTKPKKVYLNYYEECGRGLFENTKLKCELLTISNKQYFDDTGFSVSLEQPYTCQIHKIGRV